MRKNQYILIIIMTTIIVYSIVVANRESRKERDKPRTREEWIELAVENTNKMSPKQIDKNTRLLGARKGQGSIIYEYQLINIPKKDWETILPYFKAESKSFFMKQMRRLKDFKMFSKEKINVEFEYYNESKQLVHSFVVKPEEMD